MIAAGAGSVVILVQGKGEKRNTLDKEREREECAYQITTH